MYAVLLSRGCQMPVAFLKMKKVLRGDANTARWL